MADTYAVACRTIYQKPWWVGDPSADIWQGVMGGALDTQLDQLNQARAVRYPTLPKIQDFPQYACPADALQYLSAERGLEQAPAEVELAWRERLRRAWQVWNRGGTAQAHVDSLGWCGLTNVTVWRRHEWSTPPDVGSAYVRAFANTAWSQVDVLVQQPHPWVQKLWGAHTWGQYTWGSTMTAAEVGYIRRTLQQFRAGHDTVTYLYVSFTQEALWGPTSTWGSGTWGSGGQCMPVIVGEPAWAARSLL